MKTVKKATAIFLSVLMLFGMVSTSVSASYSAYLDDAILTQYNTIDKAYLTSNQQASLILDSLDVMLAKEEIVLDLPLIGTIDLTSTDRALDSIYSITGNWLFGSFTVGDLSVLETYRSDIATLRRASTDNSDIELISGLVEYLSKCAPTLVGMIDPEADFSWGIVKGFLPPEFRLITDDFNSWLDELLWDAVHPVNSEVQPSNLTLDDIVQFLCDNQLGAAEGSERAEIMGFAGVMPGFTLDIDAPGTNAYRAVEEGIYQALNAFIVPLLNGELKDVISSAVASNQENGGDLYKIINVDYTIPEYNFDRSKGLSEQLNDVLGTVVNLMLKPIADRQNTPYTFEWRFDIADGASPVPVIESNLNGILSMIIVAGGETGFDPTVKTLKEIGDYIACVAVEEFVKHMDIPDNASMEEVAYLGLRELCASVLPENYSIPLADSSSEGDYRAAVIELGADLGAYYLNNNIGLNCDLSTNADAFLSAFAEWCKPYIDGLFDATAYNLVENGTGWEKVDAILWSIIPKDWIPYEQMFKDEDGSLGIASDLNVESLVNYFLDIVFNFDIGKLYTFFVHNEDSTLYTKNVRKFIIDWVSDILNGAFTPDGETSCVPAGIDEFDDLVTDISNLTDTVCNIFKKLATDEDLQKTVLNLVVMLMGLAEPQSMSDVDIDIDSRINCTSGSVNSKMRISNFSDGVNSAWRNESGEIEQDKMYEIELVSLENNAGLTAAVTAGTKISANGYLDVAITGNVAATTEARFDLSYYILDESGNRIGTTPLVKSVYTHLYTTTGNYDVVSDESTANNVTFESFSTYLYTTNVYDASLFSILATNKKGLVTSAVDITKAIVTGTLPAGISANAPSNGKIVSIDDSSISADSYGTVNPYVSNIDPDAAQPYGIYPVTVQFEVQGKNIIGSTTTGTSAARDHIIVVYDDCGLDGVLDDAMNANRQRADYADDADAEWTAYLNAVSAGFALIHGNPDHAKMFDDADLTVDGIQTEYYLKAEAVRAAVAALDAKAVTDYEKLAELTATVGEYDDADREDYVLFTYDRFKDAYNRARDIVNSQTAPAGEEATFTAPAVKLFDVIYAENQLELWGSRLIKKTVTFGYLDEEVAKAEALNPANYKTASWAAVQRELDLAEDYADGKVVATQGKVNATRVNLMEAMIALEIQYLVPVEGTTTVIDSENMRILGIAAESKNISSFVTPITGYSVICENGEDNIGTDMSISVTNSNDVVVATYTAVVYGDLTGDGLVSSEDTDILTYYLTEDNTIIEEGTAFFVAADVDKNGVIDMDDYMALFA